MKKINESKKYISLKLISLAIPIMLGAVITSIAGLVNLFKTFNEEADNFSEVERYLVGEFEEGYYRTVARMANELIRGQVQLAAQWENMSEHERANVRRALTEIIQFYLAKPYSCRSQILF